jgi:uncharacterized protein
MKKYISRVIEPYFERKLKSSGCVLITGPKFCGKTTLCNHYAKSVTSLITNNSIQLALSDPKSTLDGKKPHLIDEWQKAPDIWNVIKDDLDKDYEFGKYILTGSTTPINPEKIQHSGAGRITTLNLKPFTLWESGESNGRISLGELFNNLQFRTIPDNPVSLSKIAYLICRGGWPISVKADEEYAIDVTSNYFDGLFTVEDESDDFTYLLKNKNIDLLKLILKSYARNISTQAKKSSIIKDVISSGTRLTLDEETFDKYVKTLKDLYLIFDMPAWNLNLRTSVSVRTAPTHHFIDTSIATSALGILPNDLLNDIHSFGLFFEDMAIRDLSVYAQSINGELKHYKDSSGQEVDAIIETKSGDYCAIEIKIYSEDNIKDAITSLNKFQKKVIESNNRLPKFRMILTSHGNCFKTEEGIFVVPLTMLKD